MIDIKGCVVTTDSTGTQKKIVKKIVKEKKAYYCLALKRNQGPLWDVDEYFKFALEYRKARKKLKVSKNFNKEHGRIETRKCYASNDVKFI